MGQHLDHLDHVPVPVAGGVFVLTVGPLGGGGEQSGVVGSIVKLNRNILVDFRVDGLVAHDTAVVQHSLTGQPLLPAGDAGGQVAQVAHQQHTSPHLGGGGAHNALTETALVQLVDGQELGDGDVARLQLVGAEPAAANRQGTNAGHHKGSGLAVALLVVCQHLGRAEHVHSQVSGEIAALEKGRLGRQLLNGRQHIQGVVNIHSAFLLSPPSCS